MESIKDLKMGKYDYFLTLAEIEQKLNIDIPDELAFNFRNVGQLLNCLTETVKERAYC